MNSHGLKIEQIKEAKSNLLMQIMMLRNDLREAKFDLMDLKVTTELQLNHVKPKCIEKSAVRKCKKKS